jgi:Secretion system C-terminal sorting domain/Reeler domain
MNIAIPKSMIVASLLCSAAILMSNAGGTGLSTTAPGEAHTCSQAGCHGSGNGNGSSGGLVDNAGPGSIVVTTSPTITSNQYVPGQLYHVTVTVAEAGKQIFGFSFEALDNSGNTDVHVDNTIGTLTITNANTTRFSQAYGTGRKNVTHKTNSGLAANTASFTFDWTAPASGIVNFYYSGVAGNNNGTDDSGDNTYTSSKQLTAASGGGAGTISLSSTSGANYQTLCMSSAINNITYDIGGGATGATASGLPAGIIGNYSAGVYTISGSPTASGIYNYTVTTTGGTGTQSSSGSIVSDNATVTLTSAVNTNSQTLNANTAITPIAYTIGGTGIGASISPALPAGLSSSFSAGVFTISGTPTSAGSYTYTVSATGGACNSQTASGSVTTQATTTGIEGINNNFSVNVFPNPVVNEINLNVSTANSQKVVINLLGTDGHTMRSFGNTVFTEGVSLQKLAVTDISSGIYILQITGQQLHLSKKVVIK